MEKFDLYWTMYLKDESKLKNKKDLSVEDFTFRPAIILDNDVIIHIAKVTTHEPRKNFENEYKIINWKDSGLPAPSTIRFSKQSIISPEYIKDKIGHLSEEDIQKIKELKLVK